MPAGRAASAGSDGAGVDRQAAAWASASVARGKGRRCCTARVRRGAGSGCGRLESAGRSNWPPSASGSRCERRHSRKPTPPREPGPRRSTAKAAVGRRGCGAAAGAGGGADRRCSRLLQRRARAGSRPVAREVGRHRLPVVVAVCGAAWARPLARRSGLRRTGGRGRERRRADRRGLRPGRSGHRRLVGLASDGALEVEILKLARPDRTGDVELVVGAGGVAGVGVGAVWASAGAGAAAKAAATNTAPARKIAFIRSRFFSGSPLISPAASNAHCPPRAEHSSIWRMNGSRNSSPSGRRPGPARCRPRPRSRPCSRR